MYILFIIYLKAKCVPHTNSFYLNLFQLRSSFTKAFSRNAKPTKAPSQSEPETEQQQQSPPPPPAPTDTGAEVAELQKQLREKDLVLTDIRLEALSSAHQLESLKDTVMKMRVSIPTEYLRSKTRCECE